MSKEEMIQLSKNDNEGSSIYQKTKPRIKDLLIYILSGISLASITFCILLSIKVNDLHSQLAIMKSKVETAANNTDNAIQKISIIESKINDLESEVKVNNVLNDININSIAGLQMAQELKFYCVTDNFFVEKASFSFSGDGIVDVYTQPAYTKFYKGQGKFDVSDRELKGELLELINIVKDVYNEYRKPTMNEFDKIKLTLTIKNYEIGTYENGQIKLKGE